MHLYWRDYSHIKVRPSETDLPAPPPRETEGGKLRRLRRARRISRQAGAVGGASRDLLHVGVARRSDRYPVAYRPRQAGGEQRLGFGEPALRELNPRLTYVSVSGVGESGPYAKKGVYDPIIQGLSGFADLQAEPKTCRPQMIRTIVADKTTAILRLRR